MSRIGVARPKFFLRAWWAALAAMLTVLPAGLAAPSAAAQAATPMPRATVSAGSSTSLSVPLVAAAAPSAGQDAPVKAATTAVADTCAGPLAFGQIVTCPSISGDERHVYTVTTQKHSDVLYATFNEGSGEPLHGDVTAPDGTHVCYLSAYPSQCRLGAAGTYTITVTVDWGGTNDYTVTVDSLKTPSSCTQLTNAFFSFASPGITATLPSGSAGHCYRFNQPLGTVLQMRAPGGDVRASILDAQSQPICSIGDTTECTLNSAGPYRFFVTQFYGDEAAYTLRMPRLSQSVGCPLLRPAAFGDPGANTGIGTVRYDGDLACHKVRTSAAGVVVVRLADSQRLWWDLYDGAGQRICNQHEQSRACALPAAGDYTLVVRNQDWTETSYQVAITALFRNAGCAPATGTAWTVPTVSVRQLSPVGTQCQPFRGQAGERILTFAAPTVYNGVSAWIIDSAGAALCQGYSETAGCVLPATGTYRVVSHLERWDDEHPEAPYELQVRRLSDPVGCPTLTPGSYGADPVGGLAGVRCRVLDVPTAGSYLLKVRDPDNDQLSSTVYDGTGLAVCTGWEYCQFPASGRYTLVVGTAPSSIVDNDVSYAVTYLPIAPSGCTAVGDDGSVHRGQFGVVGEVDCLELPSPAGSKVVRLAPGDATGVANPNLKVLDATGGYVCDAYQLYQYTCELTGTAPFFVVVDNQAGGEPTGDYALAFRRVAAPPSCPVLTRDAAGVTVTSGSEQFGFCFTVPADQHAAREAFRYQRTLGTGEATISIFDQSGLRYCYTLSPSADRTLTCTLPDGPLTVLLETDAVEAAYQVTHHDATTP
ncbi:hypothetical protein ABGB07_09120 [Micromonosporaceae bacterium B7E4]